MSVRHCWTRIHPCGEGSTSIQSSIVSNSIKSHTKASLSMRQVEDQVCPDLTILDSSSHPSPCSLVPFFKSVSAILWSTCCCCTQSLLHKMWELRYCRPVVLAWLRMVSSFSTSSTSSLVDMVYLSLSLSSVNDNHLGNFLPPGVSLPSSVPTHRHRHTQTHSRSLRHMVLTRQTRVWKETQEVFADFSTFSCRPTMTTTSGEEVIFVWGTELQHWNNHGCLNRRLGLDKVDNRRERCIRACLKLQKIHAPLMYNSTSKLDMCNHRHVWPLVK
jgi:hypothetical protein